MKLLAIETSTMLGGVAVMDEEAGVLSEVRVNVRSILSERLMKAVDFALRESGLCIEDMDALCVATGPGSFTGLRIGLATIKGLAFATGLPVTGVSTLEAFANSFRCSAFPVCPMLDARKNEVFAGLFSIKDDVIYRLMEETAIRPEELIKRLTEYEGVLFAGQGAVLYRKPIEEVLGRKARFAPAHLMSPSPSSLAHLGLSRAKKGEYIDPASLSPFYIRKSEAELKNP